MRHYGHRRVRRGFTLIELLVGIVLFAIVGTLFTKMLTTQGRFFDRQAMGNAARNVSRASLNRVVSDFRMVEVNNGVVAASPTSLTLRIPFAIGVMCANSNNSSVLSLLPVDSMTFSQDKFYGYMWRNYLTGVYTAVEQPASQGNGDPAVCTGQGITTVKTGKVIAVTPVLPNGSGLGTPVFIYAMIRYEFKASTAVPGTLGLYRTTISTNNKQATEELVAPFANTASWKFFVINGGNVAQANPPANLADIRGLELHLDGLSEGVAATKVAAESAPFTTAVFFKNRTN